MQKRLALRTAFVTLLLGCAPAHADQSARQFLEEAIRSGSPYYGEQTDKLTDETRSQAMIATRQHGAVYVFVLGCMKSREIAIDVTVHVYDAALERALPINPSPLGGRCVQFRVDTRQPFTDCGILGRDEPNQVRFSISGANSAGFYGAPNAGRDLLHSQRLLVKGIYRDEVVEIATKFSDEFKGKCINMSAREEERQAEDARRRREEAFRALEERRKREEDEAARAHERGKRLVVAEIDALKRQILQCLPAAATRRRSAPAGVVIILSLNRDGTVRDVTLPPEHMRDASRRSNAERLLRAVRDVRCQPFRLPVEKYENWEHLQLEFPGDTLE